MIYDDDGTAEGAGVPYGGDQPRDTKAVARRYKAIIARYDKAFDRWQTKAKKIIQIYLEERSDTDRVAQNRKMSLLWANVQTLQPSVYARMPHPVVSRKFRDDDSVARVASEMLERCIISNLDTVDFDDTMRLIRDDYLLVGRGQAWVRYEPTIETAAVPGMDPVEQITSEKVAIDYVAWGDFGHNVARTWPEVTTVWRKTFLTKDEGLKRFGERFNDVPLDHKYDDDETRTDEVREDKATVYEVWCKASKEVLWLAKNFDDVLDIGPPPLELERFFPCPRPVYGTTASKSLVPTPDYVFYQDQVEEIDELTIRIGKLTDALKLVGFYPSGDGETSLAIENAMKVGTENKLIPIPSWGRFKEGGGVAGSIEWVPVEMVAMVLKACFETRAKLIEDIYQITGLSDIVRGESNPNETATAQQIKSQWGSVRVRDRQMELARFIRDMCRLVGEVIAENFQPQTLLDMANMKLPTQAELDQQAMMAQQQAAQAAMPGLGGQMPPMGRMGAPGVPQGQQQAPQPDGMPPQLAPQIQPAGAMP